MKKYFMILCVLMTATVARLLGAPCDDQNLQEIFNKNMLTCCSSAEGNDGGSGTIYWAAFSGHTCNASDTLCKVNYYQFNNVGSKITLNKTQNNKSFCANVAKLANFPIET